MNLDKWGLPATKLPDGTMDSNDTLQRVGMIATALDLADDIEVGQWETLLLYSAALQTSLQPKPGIYVRYPGADPANCSADQILSALAYWVASGNIRQICAIFLRMVLRLGFAQNYKDGLDATKTKWKLPDFMLIRALPLFCRSHWSLYVFALCFDLFLLLSVAAAIGPVWVDDKGLRKRSPDDVDDNLTVLTLVVCRARYPTPLSWLAAKLYAKLRPWNYGCIERDVPATSAQVREFGLEPGTNLTFPAKHSPVYGALRWYHRAPAGNPEIAELWRPIVERYLS